MQKELADVKNKNAAAKKASDDARKAAAQAEKAIEDPEAIDLKTLLKVNLRGSSKRFCILTPLIEYALKSPFEQLSVSVLTDLGLYSLSILSVS